METAKLVVTQESLRDLALRDAGLLGVVDVSDVMGTLNDLKNQVTGWLFVWISKSEMKMLEEVAKEVKLDKTKVIRILIRGIKEYYNEDYLLPNE
jgi:hypothetical protein